MSSATLTASPAHSALSGSPIPSLRRLDLHETDSVVTIDGIVTSYYYKQLAQETIMPVLGSRRLQNRVMVVPSSEVPNRS